jgi:hypothetical protein
MSGNKLILSFIFILFLFSCSRIHPLALRYISSPNRYSLDKLPEDWKKPSTLKAVDDILPVAINQLKGTQPCMNCEAGFYITVHLDSLFILDQTPFERTVIRYGDAVSSKEITCTFRFKSHLSISDSTGKEIAQLVVVDPKEDIYSITGNPFENGRHSSVFNFKRDYSGTIGVPLVPTDNELLNFTRDKLKTIQKRILHI